MIDGLASTISRAVVAALIDAGVGAAQQPRRSNVSAVTTANVIVLVVFIRFKRTYDGHCITGQ